MSISLRKAIGPRGDLTIGNLFWKMILFALPAMGTTALQLLYVTIDLTTVHYGDSAESMGAIASNNPLINLIIVVFVNVSLGVNVVMSGARGAGNKEKASNAMHTALLFALLAGIFVGVVGFFLSDNLLRLMGTEPQYFEKAALYLKIYFCGLPFLMVYNYCAQILRAQGNAMAPFFILLISGLINVAFDCLFVFAFHMGVAGVAYATVISEGVSATLGIMILWKGKHNFVSFSFKKVRFHKEELGEILRVGLPAGLQGFFFSLPNVFIQSSLYTIDPGNVELVNGATASGNVEGYYYAGLDAISTSAMTFIAANVGAKKKDNVSKCIWYGLAWGSIWCLIVLLITLFLHRPLLSLFVDAEEAIASGRERLFVFTIPYLLNFTMIYLAAVMRGLRHSTYPMVTTMVFCTGVRILLILTLFRLDQFHTLFWLYFLFPFTWALATISNVIGLILILPKELKKISTVS